MTTRIYIRRKAGRPLGPRPIIVEQGYRRRLARRVVLEGRATIVFHPEAPEGQPSIWVETESPVEVYR